MATNRRHFLKQSAVVTLGALPSVIYRAIAAAEATRTLADGRILVVIEMSGGNDGINTVVPFADEGYAQHRKILRLPTESLIKINDSVALHPSMRSAAELLEHGKLAIVQGVGYPNPSRSHDTSMAIWHSAQIGDEGTLRTQGWIGRAMDAAQGGPNTPVTDDPQMILLGDESQPLAIQSRRSTAITLSDLTDLRLKAPLHFAGETKQSPQETNELNRFIQQTMRNATVAATSLEQTIDKGSTGGGASYPSTRLGKRMQSVSSLIKCGFGTSVYYAIQDGYDTHAAQLPTHSRLLREFGDAIKAFLDDLTVAGLSDRVCVMGFSEFGRRVAENGSAGTDHGTAGPVFIAGNHVRQGLIGKAANLLDLIDGDLRMSVDFRDVYREVTTDWLGLDGDTEGYPAQQQLRIFDV